MSRIKFIDKTRNYCQDLKILVEETQPDFEEKLFEFVYKRLVQYSCRKFNIPVPEAEDIANEAILKFLERLERSKELEISDGKKLIAYLKKVAYHVRIKEIAKGLSDTQQVEATEINTLELIFKGATLDLQVLTKEAWTIIRSKLSRRAVFEDFVGVKTGVWKNANKTFKGLREIVFKITTSLKSITKLMLIPNVAVKDKMIKLNL